MNLGRGGGLRKASNEEITQILYVMGLRTHLMSLILPYCSNKMIHMAVTLH